MNTKIFSIAAALCIASASAYSAELVVTSVPSKGKVAVAFDLVSDGNVAGLNFKLNVPGLETTSAKGLRCVAELPAGFTGACNVTKGGLFVYATSDSPDITIPAGVSPIGRAILSSSAVTAKRGPSLTVSELAVFDNDAKPINISSRVDSNLTSTK